MITFFGLVRPDGCQIGCFDGTLCFCSATPVPVTDEEGRTIYEAQGGGRGLLVIEGRPGRSALPPGIKVEISNPAERLDVQILSNRDLGDGSPEVCDRGPDDPLGGIPAIDPPDFGPAQAITDALNDFGCRFAFQPSSQDACTVDTTGEFSFRGRDTTIQFCNQVASVAAFPPGLTILTARLRDVGGNLGPSAQIVVSNSVAATLARGAASP